MKKIYFILYFLLVTFSLSAQDKESSREDEIHLSGELVNKEDGEIIPYVHIINKNTDQGTTSDLNGKFNITLSRQDTLIFSAVGYNQYTLTFTEKSNPTDHYFIRIQLDPATYELSPVNIFAFKEEAAFKQDILDLKIPLEAKPNVVIPGAYVGPGKDVNARFALGSPVSAIQNLFSKEAKELRKYREVVKDYPKVKTINEKYNMEIVKEITGLKDEKLNEFMLFCKMPDEFILQANEYEIILAVNDCYKEFLEQN